MIVSYHESTRNICHFSNPYSNTICTNMCSSGVFSLRDLLGCKYKSSTKAKKIRRKEVTVKMSDDVDALIMTNGNVAKRMKRLSEDISRGGTYLIVCQPHRTFQTFSTLNLTL